MTADRPPPPTDPSLPQGPAADALHGALAAVLAPLARLAVERGLDWAQAESAFKQAFVDAALAAHPDVAPGRAVSRISAATGMNRREVTRLMRPHAATASARRPTPATMLFTRWVAATGADVPMPSTLPRQGPAPSFESLAQAVTRDVHPRSLLEELVRLGLVSGDPAGDVVHLARDSFVPQGDDGRMIGFLGDNVGDHLSAAVANVLGDGRQHFEQALFADELSEASLAAIRQRVSAQWQALLRRLTPELQALIEADRSSGRVADRRIRIGLYSFTSAMTPAPAGAGPDSPSRPEPQEP